MKLSKKQKTILLIGIGVFSVAAFATIALAINANQKGSSVSAPTPVPVPPPISLVSQKNQAVTEIENAIASQSINDADLVQKLIAEGHLNSEQTEWRVYLQDPSLATEQEITERKEKLQTFLAILGSKNPEPTPPLPDPESERTPPPFT